MRPVDLILPHLAQSARSDVGHPFPWQTEEEKSDVGLPAWPSRPAPFGSRRWNSFSALSSFLRGAVTRATAYGALRARQERLGKKLGPYDTQIAAHAVALGAVLVSHDSAFRRILNLRVENWATDI